MSSKPADPSQRTRILVVEDEFLVALAIEHDLAAAGYSVVGTYANCSEAAAAIRSESYDLAILDVNLNGEPAFPLAEELIARGVPFLFLTGYEATHLPERLQEIPRIAKPHQPHSLIRLIEIVLSGGHRSPI
jgi:DNA-binding response OmpR family regulator